MLDKIWAWLLWFWNFLYHGVDTLGYAGIVGLMGLESSFFPFPSEVVVPPGGALAREGKMSLVLVIICGIVGSILGALFNYWLAVKLGRPFCIKYGKYFLLSEKKFEKSERFFQRHGEIGTFIGRLLPGIRQVISFPAGLARMPLPQFCLWTALGSGIWVTVLALIGYYVGKDLSVVKEHSHKILLYMLPAMVLLVAGYVVWDRKFRKPDQATLADTEGEEIS
jgi:membrane protein DedA with SNARE-associated domain